MQAGWSSKAPVLDVFERPRHPYTRGLLACIPDVRRDRTAEGGRRLLERHPRQRPSALDLPEGCAFAPRCPLVVDRCRELPPLIPVSEDHLSRCWRYDEL